MRIGNQSPTSSPDQTLTEPGRASGGLTWQAEGASTGRFASRGIHWPGGAASGVTIGRGYDMGLRSRDTVQADLMAAGVNAEGADALSAGSGLRGDTAKKFVKENSKQLLELTREQEITLFREVTYPKYEQEAVRIANKPDVVRRYGAIDFETLAESQRAVLVDLLYRGDYTPATRAVLQSALVSGDAQRICAGLAVVTDMKNVPAGRTAARKAVLGCERD